MPDEIKLPESTLSRYEIGVMLNGLSNRIDRLADTVRATNATGGVDLQVDYIKDQMNRIRLYLMS